MDTAHLRRKDTTKGPPLRVLSLDGGGVRGYSMLILLQELMYRTYVECEGKAPRRDEIPKPCDHFDLIAGTGTGGLIAIMLGRLRLDVETCKEVYVRMTRRVFETDKTIAGIPYRSTLFKASKLEDAIRQCVREHTIFENEGNDGTHTGGRASMASSTGVHRSVSRGSASTTELSSPGSPISQRGSLLVNGLMWGNPNASLYDSRENRTKTAVTAVYKGSSRNTPPALLRSYDSRKEPPPEFNCTVWQAGRATCATGLAFKPIQIGQHVFVDEGAGKYNPAPQILDEAVVNEWPGRELGVFVSIGTGKRPPGTNHRQHEWWEDFFGDTIGSFAEARRRLITKIEGCEDTHQYMLSEHMAKRNVNKDNYYRFNVEVGVGEFGMNEWSRLADISTNTRRYLSKSDVQKMNMDAAAKLARIERAHRRQASRSATEDFNSKQNMPLPPLPYRQDIIPPLNSIAVELPAEDVLFSPPAHQTRPPQPLSSPQDKFTIIADDEQSQRPHTSAGTPPTRRSASDIPSHELSASSPHTHPPRRSADNFTRTSPPPLPPKTPIPYPSDQPAGGLGGVTMPAPPPPQRTAPLPYPDDDRPPIVNKLRKPTYNVR